MDLRKGEIIMKCFNHTDREAVATCQHCGKGLCRECAALYTPCLCEECAQLLRQEQASRVKAEKIDRRQKYLDALVDTRSEFIRTCVYGVILAAILCMICLQSSTPPGIGAMLGYAVLFFFIPFGWKLLTYLQSFIPLMIIGTIWFWLFWIALKALISIVIGIPAFLYQLFKTFFVQGKIQKAQQELQAEQNEEIL